MRLRTIGLILILALGVFGIAAVAVGQVYEWIDEQGRRHFTDDLNRVPERYRSQVREISPGLPKGAPAETPPSKRRPPELDWEPTERTTVNIPGQGWRISFDAPTLRDKQESRRGEEYAFKANSGRFNISFFVEQPRGKGETHTDCYNFYWPQANKNPAIAKDTIMTSHGDTYSRVQYDMIVPFQGRTFRHRNVHYYIAFRGKWIDVHISIIEPTAEDEQVFRTFDKSLRYGV